MNLKLNSEPRSLKVPQKSLVSSVKEERRRTGRYIAVLVGICLFLLAIYHAWVRRIPVVASLVVPALIMFVYVGWVLYTASRDKHRMQDAEAALNAASPDATENDVPISELSKNLETISKESSRINSPEEKRWTEINLKGPIILVNDELPEEDAIERSIDINLLSNEMFKVFTPSRKFKRKFCRSKRQAVFKRSYSIA